VPGRARRSRLCNSQRHRDAGAGDAGSEARAAAKAGAAAVTFADAAPASGPDAGPGPDTRADARATACAVSGQESSPGARSISVATAEAGFISTVRTCPRCGSATGAPVAALGGGLTDARATRCSRRGQGANSASRTGAPPRSLTMRLFERGAELPGLSRRQGLLLLVQGPEELVQGPEELVQGL